MRFALMRTDGGTARAPTRLYEQELFGCMKRALSLKKVSSIASGMAQPLMGGRHLLSNSRKWECIEGAYGLFSSLHG